MKCSICPQLHNVYAYCIAKQACSFDGKLADFTKVILSVMLIKVMQYMQCPPFATIYITLRGYTTWGVLILKIAGSSLCTSLEVNDE